MLRWSFKHVPASFLVGAQQSSSEVQTRTILLLKTWYLHSTFVRSTKLTLIQINSENTKSLLPADFQTVSEARVNGRHDDSEESGPEDVPQPLSTYPQSSATRASDLESSLFGDSPIRPAPDPGDMNDDTASLEEAILDTIESHDWALSTSTAVDPALPAPTQTLPKPTQMARDAFSRPEPAPLLPRTSGALRTPDSTPNGRDLLQASKSTKDLTAIESDFSDDWNFPTDPAVIPRLSAPAQQSAKPAQMPRDAYLTPDPAPLFPQMMGTLQTPATTPRGLNFFQASEPTQDHAFHSNIVGDRTWATDTTVTQDPPVQAYQSMQHTPNLPLQIFGAFQTPLSVRNDPSISQPKQGSATFLECYNTPQDSLRSNNQSSFATLSRYRAETPSPSRRREPPSDRVRAKPFWHGMGVSENRKLKSSGGRNIR